jgi:ferredoxin--NADP+ reductase
MYKIVKKRDLNPLTSLMEVYAPRMASSAKPGQFLIVRSHEKGERIPLTICDYDSDAGTVTIVTQVVGASSRQICHLEEGDFFTDFAGPLGEPSEFIHMTAEELSKMKFLFIAGGLGTAPVYPQVKFLSSMGAVVDVIIGAKTKDMLIFEAEMKSVCNNLYICTDDGSYGKKGLVTNLMTEILDKESYDHLVAIGPMIMMKFVTLAAKPYNIPLTVSLNTLMVDGTGMCGACRVTVAGKTRFACVEGPEFNAYDVDFDEAMRRQGMYKSIEAEKDHICKIGLDHHNTPVK